MDKSQLLKIVREEIKTVLREKNGRGSMVQLNELEPATGAADEEKAAKLQLDKAKIDQQIAALAQKKAALQKQIDAIEKK